MPNATTPDRRGLGAPLSIEEIRAREEADGRKAHAVEEAARKPAPPPVPYRVNTSGLSTSNLANPPVRRVDQDDPPSPLPAGPSTKPKPSLPPRLPPRRGSVPINSSTSPPPPYSAAPDAVPGHDGRITPAAVNRLGSAGIFVPGLGIGNSSQEAHETSASADVQGSTTKSPQMNELQSRFSSFSTKPQASGPSNRGTSLADKQAAMRTAQSFRNDPSSVSLADARSSAATANNFRERHGDQVQSGWKSAIAVNKKYDVANRANSFAVPSSTPTNDEAQPNPSPSLSPSIKRAPPPPSQKPSFSGGSATSPPPVPISSKPR